MGHNGPPLKDKSSSPSAAPPRPVNEVAKTDHLAGVGKKVSEDNQSWLLWLLLLLR